MLPAVCAENSVCHQDGLCHGHRDAAFLRRRLQYMVPSDGRHILLAPVRLVHCTWKWLISLAVNQRCANGSFTKLRVNARMLAGTSTSGMLWSASASQSGFVSARSAGTTSTPSAAGNSSGRSRWHSCQTASLIMPTAMSFAHIYLANGTHKGSYAGSQAARPAGGRVPGAVGLGGGARHHLSSAGEAGSQEAR